MRKITVFFIFFAITALSAALSTAQSTRPMISDIEAVVSPNNEHTILTWSVSPASSSLIQELLVYRSTDSSIKSANLLAKTPLAVLAVNETNYKDFVTDHKNYYYAVIARQKNGILYDVIIPSINATVSPATIPRQNTQTLAFPAPQPQEVDIESTAPPTEPQKIPLRQKPLPYLHLLPEQENEDVQILNTETLKHTENLRVATSATMLLAPDIFPQDAIDTATTGDDYTLYLIVESFIILGNWKSAQTELEQFLQINRSEEITARATFYLGQTYYFNGLYREALASFQKTEKFYSALSKKWMKEVLNHYLMD